MAQRTLGLIVLLAAIVLIAAVALNGLGGGDQTPAEPLATKSDTEAAIEARPAFRDLSQMLARSDLVFRGTVAEIEPSEPATQSGQQPGAVEYSRVSVTVNEWLGGRSSVEPMSQVALEEEVPAQLAANSKLGDRGIYFVSRKEGQPGAYRLVGTTGRFLDTGGGRLRSSDPSSAWATKRAEGSRRELEAVIRRQQRRIESETTQRGEDVTGTP